MQNGQKRADILRWLEETGTAYEMVEHDAAYTIEEMDAVLHCGKGEVCKNLFLRDQKGKRHFLVSFCFDKQADLKKLGEHIGSKLSFASEERLEKHLNLTKGSVTPLGVFYNRENTVEVYLDSDLETFGTVGVHPCDNTATVFLSFADLVRLIRESGNPLTITKL